MIDDLVMITHHFPDEIDIVPIADVHLGAIEHEAAKWEAFLDRAANEPNTYYILLGDLLDNGTRTSIADPFKQVMTPMDAKDKMCEYLEPIASHILCCTSGNHEQRNRDSAQDLTRDIMCRLRIEDRYRESVCFLKVSIGERASQKNKRGGVTPNVSYNIVVTHSVSGGSVGAAINRAQDWMDCIEGADALVVAHTHKGAVTHPRKLVIDPRNNMIEMKDTLVVNTEAWMTYGGYALRKMLKPAESSHPPRLHLGRSRDYKRIEVTW